jgi:hypothetical protein
MILPDNLEVAIDHTHAHGNGDYDHANPRRRAGQKGKGHLECCTAVPSSLTVWGA